MHNQLILADNLSALKELKTESIDLIYIDPPFNSNRNYIGKISDGSGKEILAKFEDTWRGGMKTYIHEFMYPIVKELHRILKKTGSLYLHCDPTAQAYLQVEVLDPVFGISNFRNEIIWFYRRWTNVSKQFQAMHDVIFFYSKSNNYTFNKLDGEPSESQAKKFEKGWDQNVVTSGGKKTTQYIVYDKTKFKLYAKPDIEAKIVYRETTNFSVALPDVIELPIINSQAKERSGYPTQKPEKLLERIILASSNEGDTVLDCFLGSGTTIITADKLKRNWIGIDHNPVSISVTKNRLNSNISLFNQSAGRNYTYTAKKYNYDELRKMDDFEFEKLMVNKLGGKLSKEGKGADKGIDGIFNESGIISVKRWGKKVDRNTLDNLISAIRRYRRDNEGKLKPQDNVHIKIQKGDINLSNYDGIIAAFGFTKDTHAEVVDLKTKDNFNILLLTVEDILPVAKPPVVKIVMNENPCPTDIPLKGEQQSDNLQSIPFKGSLKERGFIAETTTTEKIENYAWTIIRLDLKSGEEKQVFKSSLMNSENTYTENLPIGSFKIICEVTDENGLAGSDELEMYVRDN
jgi:DNA modification methylase